MEKTLGEFIETLTEALKTWHPNQDIKVMEECVPICYQAHLAGFSYYKPWYEYKEMGIVLRKEFLGKGLGTWGIKAIEERAKMNGVDMLIAKVLKENKPMLHIMKKSGWVDGRDIIASHCPTAVDNALYFKKIL